MPRSQLDSKIKTFSIFVIDAVFDESDVWALSIITSTAEIGAVPSLTISTIILFDFNDVRNESDDLTLIVLSPVTLKSKVENADLTPDSLNLE